MPLKGLAGVFNLALFKRIVAAAAFSGALSGLLLTLVQQVQVIPLIHQAEVYEDAANEAAESVEHAHLHALATQDAEHEREHHYDADAWQPANGIERTLFTTGANIVIGLGFALLLSAVFAITGVKVDGRIGLLWGLAGYVIFFVAPSLSLPPEVPGTESARLVDRQVWWLITALCTTIGLSLLVFAALVVQVAGRAVAERASFHRCAATGSLWFRCTCRIGACLHLCRFSRQCRFLAIPWRAAGIFLQKAGLVILPAHPNWGAQRMR